MKAHFIGIGAHKAGTTWLHKNLNKHPEIWLPPKKELHYFDRAKKYPSPSHLSCSRNLLQRLVGLKKVDKSYRTELLHSIYFFLKDPSLENLRWYFRYYLGRHDDEWYLSLLDREVELISGEITPAYSMLDESDVADVYNMLPHAKVIFLLRNPIDRAWSAIRYRKKRRRSREDITSMSVEQLADIVNNKSFELRSDYIKTLRIWQDKFSRENLFIGFYDEILADPEKLLLRIFQFLSVESSNQYISADFKKRVNQSPKKDIPQDLEFYLAKKFYPQVKELSSTLGGFADRWLVDIEEILAQPQSKEVSA
ncbi:sulfotransferase [Nodosilinea sp. LEGE 07088]|uniref:sulfotransferase n=1 Tax=Nodosilinea sp. LEGE 07088 TaxID=2777968 RepID=UPI0018830B06|nr:sulfotransferase [Nodosilinea sp. LEGE 07088]MBE9139379.1 sulfotransferase [Nodosilinea sp. LEGE 07088]